RIRMVSPAGIITTVAGNGTQLPSGDGGRATSAGLYGPEGVAVDAAGNLFIADDCGCIRKVTPTGIITTVAGGTSAGLFYPEGIAVDAAGNLFIADTGNYRIRKVNPA